MKTLYKAIITSLKNLAVKCLVDPILLSIISYHENQNIVLLKSNNSTPIQIDIFLTLLNGANSTH